MSWFTESNRWRHFLYAIPWGLLFPGASVLGLAIGMEFKDKKYGKKFDWLDLLATVLGGLVGSAVTVGVVLLIVLR